MKHTYVRTYGEERKKENERKDGSVQQWIYHSQTDALTQALEKKEKKEKGRRWCGIGSGRGSVVAYSNLVVIAKEFVSFPSPTRTQTHIYIHFFFWSLSGSLALSLPSRSRSPTYPLSTTLPAFYSPLLPHSTTHSLTHPYPPTLPLPLTSPDLHTVTVGLVENRVRGWDSGEWRYVFFIIYRYIHT